MLKTVSVATFAVVISCSLGQNLNREDPLEVMRVSCQGCDKSYPCPEGYHCNRAGLCQLRECRRDQHCADNEECLDIPCCELQSQPWRLRSKMCRAKGVPLCEIACLVYDPVCGSDGVTYGCGQTEAHCNAVCVDYIGECRVDADFHDRVCKSCHREVGFARNGFVCEELNGRRNVWTHRECESDDDCQGDDVCQKKGCCNRNAARHWGAREPNSICVPKEQYVNECQYIDVYAPVCTYAGNDYDNMCWADLAGECVQYEGFCESSAVSDSFGL